MRGPVNSQSVRDEVAQLLSVSPADLDPEADLIASGLDSIRMMSLSGRWRKQGIDVDFAALAANPTVRAWSELVAERSPAVDAKPTRYERVPTAEGHDPAEPFPLAPIQHAMWVGRDGGQQLGGVAGHLYVEFDGAGVDPERLSRAAAELAGRHPMLRVEFLPDGLQRIGDRELPIKIIDLRDRDAESAANELLAIREAKSHQLLDGEVLELALSLLPGDRTRLHVDLDMQAADAVSYRNLMADLAAFYQGVRLPELKYTYREYRAALTSTADAEKIEEDRQWWAERIPDLPEPPALPLVPLAERANPRRSTRRWHWFDSHAREALFAACRRHGITPAMAVAASYAGTLARWSTSRRFLLNVPMFGREPFHPDVDKLVGDFTSSLMLDVDLSHAHNALSRSQAVQETLHASASHLSYSGLSVLRDLTRHRGTLTLAPYVFTSGLGLGDLFAGDVTAEFGTPVCTISQGPQVLLDAQVTPLDGGLLVNWDVREEAFRPGVIDAMFAHHLAELNGLASDDEAWKVPDSPMVPEDQRAVRAALNSTVAAPTGEALHDGFFRQVQRRPDAPAVFASSGDLSYAQLRDQALAVGLALRGAGVVAGDTVAVMGPKTAEQVPALLGILAIGAVYLPIGVDQPRDRAERILTSGAVRVALVCGGQRMSLPVPALVIADVLRTAPTAPVEFTPLSTDPADLAYVLFTSGSTGEPKGVEVTHDAAMNTVEFFIRHFELDGDDRCLALSTLECDLSVLDIFATLRSGGSIVVVDEAQRTDPYSWARLIERYQVTVLHFLPGWLEMLTEAAAEQLSSLRVVPTGGDWVRTELARRLHAQAPNLRFAGLGGATETAVHATLFEVRNPDELPAHWTAVPYGTPIANNACRVVNDVGTDCPDWVPGELWVSGRGIARSYRGRPDLTAERFVEHDGRTWYRTGDLVRYWPDGTLEFVGRADYRIKISGYRVELGEVEAAISRVPGVRMAVATVVTVPGGADLLAAAVCLADGSLTAAQLREALVNLVPAHMVPRLISFVDRIPFNNAGKIDRRAVATLLAEAGGAADELPSVAPRTVVERALCAIVAGVLGREGSAVGVHDDFFSLGGDSVLATLAVARMREWLDSPSLMVADVFATRTVAELAELLHRRESSSDRLELVAEMYLEIAEMPEVDVLSALDSTSAARE